MPNNNAELIHNTVYEVHKSNNIKISELFGEIYQYVIGQNRGPKVGWLFETLGRERVLSLLTY